MMAPSRARFRVLLGVILALAFAGQAAMLAEFSREHPAAQFPWADGALYWEMADRMAHGHWLGDTPFLSAPLYPYLLGVLRWLGADLPGVYAVQIALHLAAAVIVAIAARRRFGAPAGLAAAALYVLLSDVALSPMRLLQNGVQLLLTALLWWRWVAVAERGVTRWRDVACVAALLGLLALSYPAAILLAPALGVWLVWRGRWRRDGWVRAGLVAGAFALVIAPATIHNAVVAGEFIPISAHSGITLLHGNQPASRGVLTHIPGIVHGRLGLHESAAALFERANGRPGGFREIDRYFAGRVLDFWEREPAAAARLFAVKAYRFVTGDVYDDTEPVILDRRFGLADASVLAPLQVPWIIGLAGMGVWAWGRVLGRARRELLVEGALIALPLLVTMVFFYSPRYRLPAVPPLCGLAAYGLVGWVRMERARWPALVLAAIVPLLTATNRWTGFDRAEYMLPGYRLTLAASHVKVAERLMMSQGRGGAEAHLRAALAVLPGYQPALLRLHALGARSPGPPAQKPH